MSSLSYNHLCYGPYAVSTVKELLLLTFKHEASSVLLTAGERHQASDSFVSGVQTGGHVGG